jgi:RimJ/RimL family protein N-acetyltransferase/glycosyltransferase involved in cell wall biosynthesis
MNILIRPLEIEDAIISYKWRNDPEVWKFTGSRPDTEITEKIERDWLENTLSDQSKVRFAIIVNGAYVGNVQLTDIISNQSAIFHIFIGDKTFWGKGVARESTYQILTFAKEVLFLESVFLEVNKENEAAIKAYEKNGFTHIEEKEGFISMVCDVKNLAPPMVSIFCLVYNHEKFITQTLDGFVMQKSNFSTVIVLGEDCSTDGSRKIITDYAAKYPGKFKLLLHEKNVGALNNQQQVLAHCEGKYIAMCEGDDYWTDPLKLQKQVDFLEKNKDYGLVHANINIYHQFTDKWVYDGNIDKSNNIEAINKQELFNRLMNGDYLIRTATVLFKRELLNLIPPNNVEFLMGDTPLWLDFSQLTKFKYIDEVNTVYRILKESASKSNDKKKLYGFRLSIIEMQIYYLKKYYYLINESFKKRYNKSILDYMLYYDNKYVPIHKLFHPSFFEKIRWSCNKNAVLRQFNKIIIRFNKFLKEVARSIK